MDQIALNKEYVNIRKGIKKKRKERKEEIIRAGTRQDNGNGKLQFPLDAFNPRRRCGIGCEWLSIDTMSRRIISPQAHFFITYIPLVHKHNGKRPLFNFI